MPENTVKVDRSTRWGNPFVIWCDGGDWYVSRGGEHHAARSKADGQQISVALFRRNAEDTAAAARFAAYPHPTDIVKALRGKNLACWCALDQPCHADVLLEIANRPLTSMERV